MPPFSDHLCDRQCIQNAAENESDLRVVQVVDHQSVLVTVARGSVECCDHETGTWRTVSTLQSRDGLVVPGLSVGHTYSFRVDGGHPLPSVTIPHESRWQQEQFERRYQQFHVIGEYLNFKISLEVNTKFLSSKFYFNLNPKQPDNHYPTTIVK